MNKINNLNLLFALSSLNVLLVTIERFSFTTAVLLQPFSFIRLHEVVQMTTIILFTVLLPALLLREVSNNFEGLKNKKELILFLVFITGVYFYASGNGVHELASFQFNHFCDTENFSGDLCGGMYFNDYYFGNILYFFGGILMIFALLYLEKLNPVKNYGKKNFVGLYINAAVYSFAIFAYSGFDRVLVGLVYSVIVLFIAWYFLTVNKTSLERKPVTYYTFLTYLLGVVSSLIIRLVR